VILVDSSVWIDHLHAENPRLMELLLGDEVLTHPLVVAELALGSIRKRQSFLTLLSNLRQVSTLSHAELLELVNVRRLWGRGLSAIDAHLLGAAAITPGVLLWTRDKRLTAVAGELDIRVTA
jgi:predicted nucleic acid-binding protein